MYIPVPGPPEITIEPLPEPLPLEVTEPAVDVIDALEKFNIIIAKLQRLYEWAAHVYKVIERSKNAQ